MTATRRHGLVALVVGALALSLLLPPLFPGLPVRGQRALGVTLITIVLWTARGLDSGATALLGVALLALTGAAHANEKLLQASGCTACHSVDKKLVGPAYKDVAAKYRGNKSAEANLIKKVKAGGKGVWGDIPMPPNGHVKDEDIKTLVQWILLLK